MMEFVDVCLVCVRQCVLDVTQAYREQKQGQPKAKSDMRQKSRSNMKKLVLGNVLRLRPSLSHTFLNCWSVPSLTGVDVAVACGVV